ncbi:MAG: sporulation protein YabP [Firmicutes bacterium]|nr:sporulation protein YabP [Bacillota bacterium]
MGDIKSSHILTIDNRKILRLTGVNEVGSFDDRYVIVVTNLGKIKICGSNLKIDKICIENGQLELSGKIDSLNYLNKKIFTSGFFSKIFK